TSETLRPGSLKMAVFTFVVITLSSTYWPLPSSMRVDAQPRAVVRNTAQKSMVVVLTDSINTTPGGMSRVRSPQEVAAPVPDNTAASFAKRHIDLRRIYGFE